MSTLIVYNSRYGSSKEYAEKLQELTGIKAVSFEKKMDIEKYDRLVYIAGLYAGSVTGLKKFKKMIQGKELILVTVGIATAEGNDFVQNGIKSQLGETLYNKTKMFHLKGAIDYSTMSGMHKFMMTMLKMVTVQITKNKDMNEDQRVIIESYNSKMDLKDFSTLNPIVEFLKI